MADLKKYIYKKSEVNQLVNSQGYEDTVIDDIVFFSKHNLLPLSNKSREYAMMIENEYSREIFTFCENYWLEDFGLDLEEITKLVLSCFVDCEIERRAFYEEDDDDFAEAEYGVSMSEYIESQFVDFLEEQGLTKNDLNVNYGYLDSCCQYSIIIVKVKKEFIPFAEIAKYFELCSTSKKDTYIAFIEDWQDGYCCSYCEFDLKELKKIIKNAKLPILESNLKLSKKYKKLKYLLGCNNTVDEIFRIMNTKTEVMF